MKLEDVIKQVNRIPKELVSEGGKKTYKDKLNTITKKFKTDDVTKIIKDFDGFKKYMDGPNARGEPFSINSKKSYYTLIQSLIFTHKIIKGIPKETQNKYEQAMNNYSEKAEDKIKDNIANPKLLDDDGNIIQWQRIVDLNDLFTGEKYGSMDHLIIAFYTMIKPRRAEEYSQLLYFREPEKGKSSWNYVYKEKGIVFLHTDSNKTKQKITLEFPKEFTSVFDAYIEEYKKEYGQFLFTTTDKKNTKYAQGVFSNKVDATFNKYLGQPFGIDELRKSFLSSIDWSKITLKEKERIAEEMGHSVETQATYIRHLGERQEIHKTKQIKVPLQKIQVKKKVVVDVPIPQTPETPETKFGSANQPIETIEVPVTIQMEIPQMTNNVLFDDSPSAPIEPSDSEGVEVVEDTEITKSMADVKIEKLNELLNAARRFIDKFGEFATILLKE